MAHPIFSLALKIEIPLSSGLARNEAWRGILFAVVFCIDNGAFPGASMFLCVAQQNLVDSPSPISSLRHLVRQSGYIFDGTVLAVDSLNDLESGNLPSVRVTFRVEQAIRGVRKGQMLSIREWAGLWNLGERYRRGERLLLFLYRPSKFGLTSPVEGDLGRLAVDSGGNVNFDNARLAATFGQTSLQPPLNPGEEAKPVPRRLNTRRLALAIRRMAAE